MPLIAKSLSLAQILIVCSSAGTSWVIRIEDLDTPPSIVAPPTTMSAPSGADPFSIDKFLNIPIPVVGGLNFVTVSGTPGVVDIWFSYAQQPV